MVTEVKTKDNLTYICDECKKSFKADKVRFIKKTDNISIFGMSAMIISKDGKIMRCNFDSIKSTDRLLACPHCERVHFNGFDVKK